MDELEKNSPDDFWRKTFDEAAETPPPRVWASIERQLDESNNSGIIPLWGLGIASSKPWLWATGIAASLALLLVGWWAISIQSTNQFVGRPHSSSKTEAIALNSTKATNSSIAKSSSLSKKGVTSVGGLSAATSPSSAEFTDPSRASSQSSDIPAGEVVAQVITRSNQRTKLWHRAVPTVRIASATSMDAFVPTANRLVAASFEASATTAELRSGRIEIGVFKELKGRPLRLRSPGPIQRIVWSRPAELPTESTLVRAKRKATELWASISAMPGSFNPMVSLRSAPIQAIASSANTLIPNSNQSAVNSRASFSVAYQASAGVQLGERWSVESGVGYLAGRSTVDAPVQSAVSSYAQTANTNRSASSNVYVNALQNSSSPKGAYNASPATNYAGVAYDLVAGNSVNQQAQQTLTNDYQFVQVPVQVGYQLRPRKKVSLAVLGGFLTNIFVRNTVGSDVVVTAKDGIYKPVSLAATMGARLRYRPSGRWSASMAGLYQPSLNSVTETDSQVQSRPTSTGMSLGLDYHF